MVVSSFLFGSGSSLPELESSSALDISSPVAAVSLIAAIAASLHSAARSAPLYPFAPAAISCNETSPDNGKPFDCTAKIASRCVRDGNGISTSRSNRPGRRSAGSTAFGRFVVATITGFSLEFGFVLFLGSFFVETSHDPPSSISVSSCATTRLPDSPVSVPRAGHIASISSSKITQGTFCLEQTSSASLNVLRNFASASPAYGPNTSPAESVNTTAPASAATATTEAVLPTPGGPCNKTPLGNVTPKSSASSPYKIGHEIASRSVCKTSVAPAILVQAFTCSGWVSFFGIEPESFSSFRSPNVIVVFGPIRTHGTSFGVTRVTTIEFDAFPAFASKQIWHPAVTKRLTSSLRVDSAAPCVCVNCGA
mmetsp:Transcript_2878/g.10958  ORF Transcript_2878/g.10958 Transcript_2878/m.10958 type:complete len:367 (+) Transcript_2878:1126-2226(+)